MNKRNALIATILSILFFVSTAHAVTKKINPTVGQTAWTICKKMGEVSDETTATPIVNASQIGGIITIDSSGNYQVAENLIYPISIEVDGVYLNLDGYTVSHNNVNDNVITITWNSSEININNGYITNLGGIGGLGSGLEVGRGSTMIHLENLNIFNCAAGVKLTGTEGQEITACELVGLDLISNATGLRLEYADEITVTDCNAIGSLYAGFDLFHSEANGLFDCRALKTIGPKSAIAFRSDSGQGNIFQDCVAKKTQSTAEVFGYKVYGFLLTGTEAKTKVIDCIINDTDITQTGSSVPYGLRIAPTFLSGNDLLATVTMTNVGQALTCVVWAPDAQHLAYADTTNRLFVSIFNGADILSVATYTALPEYANSVAWSPDGQYLVTGDNGYYVRIFKVVGNSLILVDSKKLFKNIPVLGVAWSPSGQYIACGDALSSVHIFSFNGLALTHEAENGTPGDDVNSVTWSPDSKYVASGGAYTSSGNQVNVFSVTGAPGSLSLDHIDGDNTVVNGAVKSIEWSPNGKYIACGDSVGNIIIYNFDGTTVAMVNVNGDLQQSFINGIAWSPDGDYIVDCDDKGFVRAWSFDLTSTVTFTYAPTYFTSLSWGSDGRYIATSDLGGSVRIFKMMFTPESCLIDGCKVCDTNAAGGLQGLGISGGGNNFFVRNIAAHNDLNYSSNILNVYNNTGAVLRVPEPFDNISIIS